MKAEHAWIWAPMVVTAAALLWAGPLARLPKDDEAKARAGVVALEARDPASLVMPPIARCRAGCPTTEKPR